MTTRETFKENYNTALNEIVDRLEAVTSEFGPTDFPEDSGIAMRDGLLNFAYSLITAIDFYCYEQPKDPWAIANGERVKQSKPGAIYAVTGTVHFYIECWKFVRRRSGQPANKPMSGPGSAIRKTLDWLTNIYAVAPDVPVQWFKITTSATSLEMFEQSAEVILEDTISFELGSTRNTGESTWPALALVADFSAFSGDADEWTARCKQIFGN